MDEIRKVEIIAMQGNTHMLSGQYRTDVENAVIKIDILQNGELRNETAARVVQGKFATRPFTLQRGMYQLRFRRCIDPKTKPPVFADPIDYATSVMAGQKYPVRIEITSVEMYGKRGVQVSVDSREYTPGDQEIYYEISKPDAVLRKIHFGVPFQGEQALRFFVEGVSPEEINFPADQNGYMDIQVTR